MPTFTRNWFNDLSRPLWQRWLKDVSVDRYLEIGVLEGQSMLWVIENKDPSVCYGIDPFVPRRKREADKAKEARRNAMANLRPYIERGKLMLIEERSQPVLLGWNYEGGLAGYFDLQYIDGDHRGRQALEDMVLAWPLLKVGGVMILDDYNRRWHRHRPWSREAINGFLGAYESLYEFVYRTEQQIAIRKVKDN